VDKGFSQVEGIDYSETFSLVSQMNSIMLDNFMLVCILPLVGGFRPMVHLELTNKNPKALTYQSSAESDEGLT
jgi:hypothetical protein